MVTHHLAASVSVFVSAYYREAHPYTLALLSTECTTPFINFRWLLEKMVCSCFSCTHYHLLSILPSLYLSRLSHLKRTSVSISMRQQRAQPPEGFHFHIKSLLCRSCTTQFSFMVMAQRIVKELHAKKRSKISRRLYFANSERRWPCRIGKGLSGTK